jgi:EpsI family protein
MTAPPTAPMTAPSTTMGQPVSIERRQLLLGGAMLFTAIASRLAMPHAGPRLLGPKGFDPIIPAQFGGWRIADATAFVMPPQDELQSHVYDQVLTRSYSDGQGDPVMLLLAFGGGQTGVLEIHRPEACYPAQGFRLSNRQELDLPIGGTRVPAVTCTATGDTRVEQLLYWSRIGSAFPRNWMESQVATIGSNIKGILPDGILVRMSIASEDVALSRDRLERFAAALVAASSGVARKLLLGGN